MPYYDCPEKGCSLGETGACLGTREHWFQDCLKRTNAGEPQRNDLGVFVDSMAPCIKTKAWKYSASCHLFCTPGNVTKMMLFAEEIGLKREWLQDGSMPHFDLTKSMRDRAVAHGAVEVCMYITVDVIRMWRSARAKARSES